MPGTRRAPLLAEALGVARERILLLLKTKGPRTSAQVASRLGVTAMAVRQHLAALEDQGLVRFRNQRGQVGRPARLWQLTPEAHARFPDRHAELAVSVLEAVRTLFGERALVRLGKRRLRLEQEAWKGRMPAADAPLGVRVATLARLRRQEGFMAEWQRQRDGGFVLLENHCAIAAGARAWPGWCDGEIALFRAVLGADASVERIEHILSGDRCCAYRIRPA
ncbi:MAG: transcriptional regulator [Polyangiaceae bacterium]|nr:transcriptional regulator [Polyangiaceae bacterium]